MNSQSPLVILDRDGVINQDSPDFIKTPDEWLPIPGSLDAIARLTGAGFLLTIASNQSGLARGLFSRQDLERIHRRMLEAIRVAGGDIAGIFICPHGPDEGCDCRKPRPGLYRQIAAGFSRDLAGIPVVGDSRRDLQAAAEVGARPILVRTGNGLATLSAGGLPAAVEVYADLAAVADVLIEERQ